MSSEQESRGGQRLTDYMPPQEPNTVLVDTLAIPRGWTEWYRYKSGRYREIVVERRRNPMGLLGPAGVMHLTVYGLLAVSPWESLPGPLAAIKSGVTGSNAIALLPLIGMALVGLWVVAGVVVRLQTREREQFDRKRMYPPSEYWEGVRDAG